MRVSVAVLALALAACAQSASPAADAGAPEIAADAAALRDAEIAADAAALPDAAPASELDAGRADAAAAELPDASAGADASSGLLVYQVPPASTDPSITQWTEDHFAMRDTRATLNGQLLVFLPGSTMLPSDYQLLLSTGAGQGYLAIALRYPNDWDAGDLIDASDPDCTLHARLEIVDGTDRTSVVTVEVKDSIIHRLVALIGYLDAAHPADGWGKFVSGGQPVWTSIALAGHSLGSGEAAVIGMHYWATRVAMFSGPNDHCAGSASTPAPWLASTGPVTPAARYGFAHLEDPEEALELAAWSQLGLDALGASINVDKHVPPYQNSHELKTDALPSDGSYGNNAAHRSTAVDADTPMSGGVPVFAPVWRYVLGP